MLKVIGYWKAEVVDNYPCPQELEANLPAEFRERLVQYLESPPGAYTVGWVSFGFSWCRYGCKGGNGSRELSDGLWIWPEGLAHYVKRHNVGLLPEAFLQRVAAQREPSDSITQRQLSDDVEEATWVAWAAKYRTPEFEAKLSTLPERVARARAAGLEREAQRLVEEHGVSAERCWTKGCSGWALRINPLCAHCYGEAMGGRFNAAEGRVLASFLGKYRP